TSASPRCVLSVLRGESPSSTDLTPEQRAGGAPLPSDTHQRRPMLAEEPSAVRQGVMALAIGLALYAQLAVHQTPEDVVSWLAFAVAAVLAALVAGQRERPAAATLPDGAAWRGSAVRLALGALAVGAIAATTYLSTNRRTPVLALSLWLASPLL